MTAISGDQQRGIKARIKVAIKQPSIRAAIQATVGYLLLLAILSTPSIWLALSIPNALIGPIYAFVSFSVVLQVNVGTAINWVIQRLFAASLAGTLGLCCMYITYAANGASYLPSVTKAAVMTTFTSILGFLIIMGGYKWHRYWFGFIVASLSLPIVALSGFHLPYVEVLTMPYFVLNVCIGVAMAAIVSMVVLPITAGSTIRSTTSTCLLLLGQGTKELMEILLIDQPVQPIQQKEQHQQQENKKENEKCDGTASSSGSTTISPIIINLTGFIESWTNPVSTALVKAKALLVPVATEIDIYHRPVLFPRYAYGCLLDLLRHYMSTLMTLVYLAQGDAPLRAVKSLKNEILPVVEKIENCFSTAAAVLENSGRGGGALLDTDFEKAAVLYIEGLEKLTELESALHILSTKHIDMVPFYSTTNTTTLGNNNKMNGGGVGGKINCSTREENVKLQYQNRNNDSTPNYTEGEIVMADTVIAIIFALGSRLRRLYFVLPETLSHKNKNSNLVWEAWRRHYKGQTWDFEVEENTSIRSSTRSSREEEEENINAGGRSRRNSREESFGIDNSGYGFSPVSPRPSPSSFSSVGLRRQVSEVRSPLTPHHLASLAKSPFAPSSPLRVGKCEKKDQEKLRARGGAGQREQQGQLSPKSSSSSSRISFFSTLKQWYTSLPNLVDMDLPWGFTGEGLVLSLQVGIALAAATVVHVCSASYEALNKNTIWVVVTVAVLAQKSVGGVALKGYNRVVGTIAAGILGLG
jgi:Aluminium activated malate transporter